MGCESFDVVRLGPWAPGPLLQGQIRVVELKSAFGLLISEKCCFSVGGYIQHLATDASLV